LISRLGLGGRVYIARWADRVGCNHVIGLPMAAAAA
jgi:hypothetical protein